MPRCPARRCRRQWSSSGIRKLSVLPDPVPVVTSVGRGMRSRDASRIHASAWWRCGVNPSGAQSRCCRHASSAGRNGSRSRTNGPRNTPSFGSATNRSSSARTSSSARANVVPRKLVSDARRSSATREGSNVRCVVSAGPGDTVSECTSNVRPRRSRCRAGWSRSTSERGLPHPRRGRQRHRPRRGRRRRGRRTARRRGRDDHRCCGPRPGRTAHRCRGDVRRDGRTADVADPHPSDLRQREIAADDGHRRRRRRRGRCLPRAPPQVERHFRSFRIGVARRPSGRPAPDHRTRHRGDLACLPHCTAGAPPTVATSSIAKPRQHDHESRGHPVTSQTPG